MLPGAPRTPADQTGGAKLKSKGVSCGPGVCLGYPVMGSRCVCRTVSGEAQRGCAEARVKEKRCAVTCEGPLSLWQMSQVQETALGPMG